VPWVDCVGSGTVGVGLGRRDPVGLGCIIDDPVLNSTWPILSAAAVGFAAVGRGVGGTAAATASGAGSEKQQMLVIASVRAML